MTDLTRGILIGIGIGWLLFLLQLGLVIAFGRAAHVEEQAFSDDPRPALLKEQAE